jgi:serine/threonine protein kinase
MQMGTYELHVALGRGGSGTVYRGTHLPSGRSVAVKVLAAELALNSVTLRRFEQEFAAACRLTHPNIVRGLDFGVEKGVPFLVMELIDGQNLGQRVRDQGPLTQVEALRVTLQIAEALRLAHNHQLVHRDVKPENILLAADGRALLTDLGLMKDLNASADLTRSRACLGTVAYMAPEQFENARHADARSDLYGLASTLYFALTGVPPFRGRGNLGILRKKLNNEFTPPSQLVPSLPAALDRAISTALDVSPARRPACCDEWMSALRAATATAAEAAPEQPADSRSPPPPQPQMKNRRAATRYPSLLGASCQRVQGSTARWQAEIQDISLTGLRMTLDRRFEVGTVLTLEILDEQGNGVAKTLARVQWVRETSQNRWSVGCAFHRPLTEDDLDTLLESRSATVVLHQDARRTAKPGGAAELQ